MRSAKSSRALLLAAFLGLIASGAAENATCIYPNGDIADSEHFPCDPNATTGTTCCPKEIQCLSNGLCNDNRYENYGRVLRGACTDKEFGGFCNKVCTDYWPQGDEAVWYCGEGKYCCSRLDTCCTDDKVRKQFQGEPKVVALAGKTTPKATDFTTYPIETGFYDPTATTSSTSTSSSTSSPAPSTDGNTLPIAIGIGVGVGGGIVIVALLVFFCWWRRRKNKKTAHTMHELPAGTPGAGQPPAAAATPYIYDERTGGWTTKAETQWSRPTPRGMESGGAAIHEAGAGTPAVEMQAGYLGGQKAIEMDSPGRWSEGRQSKFVEGDLWGQGQVEGQGAHAGHAGPGAALGHTGGYLERDTVGTEKDIEGSQRRLSG